MSQLEKMNHQHQHARSPKEAHGDFFSHYFLQPSDRLLRDLGI
jgi:hypothetical protein